MCEIKYRPCIHYSTVYVVNDRNRIAEINFARDLQKMDPNAQTDQTVRGVPSAAITSDILIISLEKT